MSNIIDIAELIEYLTRKDITAKDKATAVKLEIENGTISLEDGLDLVIYYTNK